MWSKLRPSHGYVHVIRVSARLAQMSQRFFWTSRGLSGACGRLCWFGCSLNGSPNLECPHNHDNDNILTAVRPGCDSHANDRSLCVQRETAIIVGNVRSSYRSRQCSVGRPDGGGHLPTLFPSLS